jgi:hypothetical protein
MTLVIATALATGLVVANWKSDRVEPTAQAGSQSAPQATPQTTAPRAPAQKVVAAGPTQADTEACNLQAKNTVGNRTIEVVKDAAIGGAIGAGTGAAGGAIAGGGKGAGQGAGIGGVVGLAAGTLYGLNATKSNDARYVEAYRACMRNRGFTG